MMAHGALLTALLSACAASGQDVGAGGLELRSLLQAHAGGPHSNPAKGYLQEYLGGLTHAAHDGTINSEGEVPPPPPVADDDADGAEAELRWLQASDASNASNASNVTTTAETTTTAEPGLAKVIEVKLKVDNVNYDRLKANQTAYDNFILVAREALAFHFGVKIDRVVVTLKPGSVIVDGIVNPPVGTTAAEFLESHTDEGLASTVVQYIRDADTTQRIGADVVTGVIAVDASSVLTDIIPLELTTTAVLAFTCRCRDGTAATGLSCTADNAEVCDQCNDGFALNADKVCEVSKTGALTSGRMCVYRFIGGGYCHPMGMNTEKRLRIGTWVDGNRQDAEKACCREEMCGGFHLDKDNGDFVLLRQLATSEDSWERRECWKKKIAKDGEDLEEPDSAPLQALPLAAAAAAMLLHAAGA